MFDGLLNRMFELGCLDLDKGFIDATFAAAKGGGQTVGLTRKGKGTKIQMATDAQGIPLAVSIGSAGVGEPQMVRQPLEFIAGLPEYSRNTKKPSKDATAMRQASMGARDPACLIFRDPSLPAEQGDFITKPSITPNGRCAADSRGLFLNRREMRPPRFGSAIEGARLDIPREISKSAIKDQKK
ncbi:hypothetical protein KBB96_09350 [Luteolibacter ambystomatis]|uniref:Uncharacterized protein n=1 Tax=Luteolibacter ambystomatis TaxID=2824561 RepID=A0A975J304_9BACT|nr:hypothetical protein [Luteolibacter ambystomatis]QUE53084.1 hypothetical protein KBB96_09350 [Luteolibacter ambystomatis]